MASTTDCNAIGDPGLSLPDGVTLSPTALLCQREPTLAEWKSLGRTLSRLECSIQWWLGDWWHYGQHQYGQRAKAAARNAFGRGYAFGTLMNCGYVAGRIETSRRREVLSFAHHYEVAKLDAEEQERWLDLAVRDKLSVKKLRAKIYEEWSRSVTGFTDHEQRIAADLERLVRVAKLGPAFFIAALGTPRPCSPYRAPTRARRLDRTTRYRGTRPGGRKRRHFLAPDRTVCWPSRIECSGEPECGNPSKPAAGAGNPQRSPVGGGAVVMR